MKKLCALLAAISLATAGQAFAQSSNGAISGFVQDSSQVYVPGVTVTATNTQTDVATMVISNEAGAYTLLSLLPGTYRLSATLPGFKTSTVNNVVLGAGASIRYNFTMEVGQVANTVDVTVSSQSIITDA